MLKRAGDRVPLFKARARERLVRAVNRCVPPVRRLREQRDRYAAESERYLLERDHLADELQNSVRIANRGPRPGIDDQTTTPTGGIDVKRLIETLSVDQLAIAADEYYRTNLANVDYYFAKPMTAIDEARDYLSCFAQLLAGVRPLPAMRILDFGAGTGWTSRALAQLGCDVVVCDVSATALAVARELFERQPIAGSSVAPTFLLFDGHRLELEDASIDRVVCFDAFHHLPNPQHVLGELGRVLKQGGIAGFQEPGPNHSKTAQSQFEMRNFTVIENDIVMRDIERWAKAAGFTDVELAVFTSDSFRVPIAVYDELLVRGQALAAWYEHAWLFLAERRVFFLSKGEQEMSDSRERRGLLAHLDVRLDTDRAAAGDVIHGVATVSNTGTAVWLPSHVAHGPVQLGAHLYSADGRLLDRDYARVPLPSRADAGIRPGESAHISFELPVPPAGDYIVEFDMVAERVCWFQSNGSKTTDANLHAE